ncbi:hypothetical protein ACLOJK_039475 [Asimina triloba]
MHPLQELWHWGAENARGFFGTTFTIIEPESNEKCWKKEREEGDRYNGWEQEKTYEEDSCSKAECKNAIGAAHDSRGIHCNVTTPKGTNLRTAADQILRELQNNPDTWLQVVHILQNSQNLNTKFFALQVVC